MSRIADLERRVKRLEQAQGSGHVRESVLENENNNGSNDGDLQF